MGWEDPLERETATHSNTFAWRISWTEDTVGLQSMESQRVENDGVTNIHMLHTHTQTHKRNRRMLSDLGFISQYVVSL